MIFKFGNEIHTSTIEGFFYKSKSIIWDGVEWIEQSLCRWGVLVVGLRKLLVRNNCVLGFVPLYPVEDALAIYTRDFPSYFFSSLARQILPRLAYFQH